jgi:hypothetical protein
VYGSARWKPSRPRGHGARAPCEPRAVTETRSWHPGGGGRTGCGRQTPLADELAVVTRVSGRAVIRASLDGFHRPRSDRYARGRDSPEGYSTTRSISSASGRTCSSRSGRLDQAGTEARLSSTSGIGLSMGPGVGCRPGTCSSSMGNLPAAARAYRLLESTDLRGTSALEPPSSPRSSGPPSGRALGGDHPPSATVSARPGPSIGESQARLGTRTSSWRTTIRPTPSSHSSSTDQPASRARSDADGQPGAASAVRTPSRIAAAVTSAATAATARAPSSFRPVATQ